MRKHGIRRTGVFLAMLFVGCMAPPTSGSQPPDLSALDQADPPIATPPPTSCTNGYRVTFIPRNVGVPLQSVRTSTGVWHSVYLAKATSSGQAFYGLRHVSSDDLAHPRSIGWVSNEHPTVTLGIGPDDIPTVVYPSWVPSTAPRALTRARFVAGSWQVDPAPFWTSDDPLASVLLSVPLAIDRNNHAHVAVGGYLLTDASGAWVASNVAGPIAKPDDFPNIVALAADGAGHDYFTVSSMAGFVLATDASGALQTLAGVDAIHDNQFLAADAHGDVRGFGLYNGDIVSTDLTTMAPPAVLGMADDPRLVADAGAIDAAGNPSFYAYDTELRISRLVSVVNGAVQSRDTTFVPANMMLDGMVVDGDGTAHFTVYLTQGQSGIIGYLDPC